jgi:putative transposase
MTQIQFNLDMDLLKESVMDSNINSVIKASVVLILNEYMEFERDKYLNAKSYERSSERRDYRNGYYERELLISLGRVKLRVPRTRDGHFSPSIFERYSRIDQALLISMLEMVVNGVSTRKVTTIVEQLCGESVSKSLVSSLTEKLDPIVNQWANRPLNVQYFPYLSADAMYIKVREHNKVVSKAVYIMTGLNEQKKREIIGLKIDHVESYVAWQGFFKDLKARGLQSPKLVVSDAHSGLKKAIEREFIGTSWQRCTVHFKRNIISTLPKKEMKQVIADLRRIYHSISSVEARKFKDEFVVRYQDNPKIQKAIEVLEDGFNDSIQYLNEPESFQKQLTSTNALERLNQEVRRREQVIRIFPNTQSAFRLIGAVLMENENLQLNKRIKRQ